MIFKLIFGSIIAFLLVAWCVHVWRSDRAIARARRAAQQKPVEAWRELAELTLKRLAEEYGLTRAELCALVAPDAAEVLQRMAGRLPDCCPACGHFDPVTVWAPVAYGLYVCASCLRPPTSSHGIMRIWHDHNLIYESPLTLPLLPKQMPNLRAR